MNIFCVDNCWEKAAQSLCDKHVVKMVLESAQMLSTAHVIVNGTEGVYKPTHKNHPCSVWCRSTRENYKWLFNHFRALAKEYEYRYSKVHKSWVKLKDILNVCPNIELGGLEPFRKAMDDNYISAREIECPVMAYREYYRMREKEIEMKWTKRERPLWLNNPEKITTI